MDDIWCLVEGRLLRVDSGALGEGPAVIDVPGDGGGASEVNGGATTSASGDGSQVVCCPSISHAPDPVISCSLPASLPIHSQSPVAVPCGPSPDAAPVPRGMVWRTSAYPCSASCDRPPTVTRTVVTASPLLKEFVVPDAVTQGGATLQRADIVFVDDSDDDGEEEEEEEEEKKEKEEEQGGWRLRRRSRSRFVQEWEDGVRLDVIVEEEEEEKEWEEESGDCARMGEEKEE